ncbi:phosphoglycerate dehydrogenase [Anaerospora hongkongensis]|uniref:phosphoglycerate dehydrogenase n=1 Tax=Anaerospora hongkongensis TaxID=244830 RepID=UPI002897A3FA|nr:phosphoglycerate dehydrogenase [Anaerospora hongkongensis]
MPKKVLIAARSFSRSKEAKAILEAQGYELILNPYDRPMTEAELVEMIAGVDALVAGNDDVTGAVIAAGVPDLKIIAKHGVGYNNIDVSTAKQYGIPVTVAPGANSQSVAELAFGLLLACVRSIPQMDCSIRVGSWDRVTGYEVGGKVLGIVGMGNIGGEVAKRACGFNMKIIAYDIYPNPEFIKNYGVTYLPLPEVITQADFLSLHAPSTPGTVGMINRTTLMTMKKTAFLINTARGDLVNEEDLYEALSSGIIAGAALDTFAKEPLENSPLLTLKNIIVTPHAGAATHEGVIRTGLIGAGEVVRVLSGQAPHYAVK